MSRRGNKDPGGKGAYEKALALLVRREHSARELLYKLEQRGFSPDENAAALARLQASDYQNDARFGEMLVRSRIESGYGPRWIVAELKTHGVDEDAASRLLDASDADWVQVAAGQLRRRYGAAAARGLAEQRKRHTYLLRRGFDASTVQSVIRADESGASADELD